MCKICDEIENIEPCEKAKKILSDHQAIERLRSGRFRLNVMVDPQKKWWKGKDITQDRAYEGVSFSIEGDPAEAILGVSDKEIP